MTGKFDAATLINEVRRRPILWQSDNKGFKNKSVTDILWEEIGKECSCPGAVAKQKWKNLKDNYRRKLRRQSCYVIKWSHFPLMDFIKDYVAPANNKTCLPGNSVKEEPQELIDAIDANELIASFPRGYLDNCTQNFSDVPVVTSSNDSTRSYKKRRIDVDEEYIQLEEPGIKLLEKELSNENEESFDFCFFKSLLPFMEKLSPLEKLEVRGEIQNIIVKKLQTVNREAVK